MPNLPRLFRPPHLGPRKAAEQRRQRDLGDRRGPRLESTSWWQRQRRLFRMDPANALCMCCKANGVVKETELVDHILPHGNVDGPLFRDASNWQSLCEHCDKTIKRRLERAYAEGKASAAELRLDRPLPEFFWAFSDPHPKGLRPSAIPLTIVCGPPASGKTTYVAKHQVNGDVCIDLDQIGAQLSGGAPETWPREFLAKAVSERNSLLGSLASRRAGRAWFIVGEPLAEDRQWWADTLQPERIVVLEVKPAECLRRCRAHAMRRDHMLKYKAIVESWWSRYTIRDGDQVIR